MDTKRNYKFNITKKSKKTIFAIINSKIIKTTTLILFTNDPIRFWIHILFLCASCFVNAQNHIKISAELDDVKKELFIKQEVQWVNTSNDIVNEMVLNDWNHAFSEKNSPLAQRFSDAFLINFHLAKSKDRGFTKIISMVDENGQDIYFQREENQLDVIKIKFHNPLQPGAQINFSVNYIVKLPNAKFTGYGFHDDGNYDLKDCFLLPAMFQENRFVTYSQLNIDDASLSNSNYDISFTIPNHLHLESDLTVIKHSHQNDFQYILLNGACRNNFSLNLATQKSFLYLKNANIEVASNLKNAKLNDINKIRLMDQVVQFVSVNMGQSKIDKIMVTQTNYDRNPVYGINQLPRFLTPFADEFVFEMQFLKTYLDAFLHANLTLNYRKDSWILDGIQIFMMMKYVEMHYPDAKMMGNISRMKLLKSYHLMNLDFNEQYSYFYMLMARKNLDQPVGFPKNQLIKFNEQIANKYKSGLNFNYLDAFLNHDIVQQTIRDLLNQSKSSIIDAASFKKILEKNTQQDIDWFFEDFLQTRNLVDFTLKVEEKTSDSIILKLKNKSGLNVPIPIYGIKDKSIAWKKWFENVKKDTLFKVAARDYDRMIVNYEQDVPEYNLRNNWQKTKPNLLFNRSFKFNLVRDLENPNYNQIMANPVIIYSLYDGISPGMRFHNKAILDKPFTFDIVPIYATETRSLIGSFNFTVNDFRRDSKLFHIRYTLPGSYFHYAPDASYFRLTPMVQWRIREDDFRNNRRQMWMARSVNVFRESSEFTVNETENYSVFNLKYIDTDTEMTRHFSYNADLQISNLFGKLFAEVEFRHLNQNNRQFNLRAFAGMFLYRQTNNDFFGFHLDRPSDYMFDFPLYGRSESSGFFSQQLVMAEGGFKSRMMQPIANQWMSTLNGSASLWKWIEIYSDVGLVKSDNLSPKLYYDAGIRLNIVTDYFEIYFPIHSSLGWEIGQLNYEERIRFMLTLNPKVLTRLFTRSWF